VGVRLMDGDGKGAAVIQLSGTALVLAGVVLAPGEAGLLGPAIGFVIAQSLVAAVVVAGLVRRPRGVVE